MPDPWLTIAAYLAIGAFVGFFAGMLGIGGGAIIVPLLAAMFEWQALPRDHVVHLAVGTAMATILFTSVSSVLAHARRGGVRWDLAKALTPGILFGGLAGALLAGKFSTFGLAVFFAIFVYLNATNMFLDLKPKPARQTPGPLGMFIAGTIISGLSALVAIGGAVLSIPFLVWCNVSLLSAIGTASAIGFPIALGGTVGYVLTGMQHAGLPPYSFGFIYLPALVGVSIGSVLTAPLGAKAAHSLPTKLLRRIFAVLLFVLATRMLVTLW